MPIYFHKSIPLLALCIWISGCTPAANQAPNTTKSSNALGQTSEGSKSDVRPNILLIVADDLGFSDLGVYGSEINTPNLDSLARGGVMFSQFYTASTCSPTRAMLLSGMDNHLAGLGNMKEEVVSVSNQKGRPGYEGHLNSRVASLAELLNDAGYHTYMTGKWHLGKSKDTNPLARGFEKSFALVASGAGHFDALPIFGPGKANFQEDGQTVDSLADDFYSSRFYAERMIEYIDSNRETDQPFFAYLAFTAPHWPLQAPEESIAKYHGKYDSGYDALHAQRLARMQSLALVSEEVKPYPRMANETAWEELSDEQKKVEARKMEIYAAMVDDLDRYVGSIVNHLKKTGEFENTFILFMSDNGPEGHHLEKGWEGLAEWVEACCDNSYENLGKADSYVWYGPNWARAGAAPGRMFKGFVSDGGIRVPAFVHYPKMEQRGVVHSRFLTVKDVMPTFLELAGTRHPGATYRGRPVLPIQGSSMLAMLNGEAKATHTSDYVMGWELFNRRAIHQGDWKILWEGNNEYFEPWPAGIEVDRWQLFNLAQDPAELNDLSVSYPDKLEAMTALWERYAKNNGVILPNWTSGY